MRAIERLIIDTMAGYLDDKDCYMDENHLGIQDYTNDVLYTPVMEQFAILISFNIEDKVLGLSS